MRCPGAFYICFSCLIFSGCKSQPSPGKQKYFSLKIFMAGQLKKWQSVRGRFEQVAGLPDKPDTSVINPRQLSRYFKPFFEADITDSWHADRYKVSSVRDGITGDLTLIYDAKNPLVSPSTIQLNLDGHNQVSSVFSRTFGGNLFYSHSDILFYKTGREIRIIRFRKFLFFPMRFSEQLILIRPIQGA
ncbi:MAG TPA: hypothetical protein VNE41_00390 [Chitinophagaceae bacterium]|nr:hypothetical protein [Chitinophagaceae bacterium]